MYNNFYLNGSRIIILGRKNVTMGGFCGPVLINLLIYTLAYDVKYKLYFDSYQIDAFMITSGSFKAQIS